MNRESLYSYHVFLFPFQWYYTGRFYADKTLEEKTELKKFVNFLKNTPWKHKGFSLNNILNYNEYNYFYDFVRDVLYDKNGNDSEGFIANYYYDIEPGASEYRFEVNWLQDGKTHTKEYKLLIESLILHLYSTGVGVISFHLNNRIKDQSSPEDILRINQYGRRIYPPFFGLDNEEVGKVSQYDPGGFEPGLRNTQLKELANWIYIDSVDYHDDFSRYIDSRYFDNNPFQLPKFISAMFPGIKLTTDPGDRYKLDDGIFISPLLDDRMFVVCWYGDDDLVNQVKSQKVDNKQHTYPYLEDNWWYQYVFIDAGGPTCQNEMMKKELLKSHTNARWAKYGTLFGVSRYSFVCLTSSLDTLKSNNAAFLVNHVQTMYYKLSELCLVQRACILRFGDEVAEISSMHEKIKKNLAKNVSNLYKQYIRFVNKIYFREVTAQEQGIELYDLLQQKMRIVSNVEKLDKEIEELHNYVSMKEQTEQTVQFTLLTWIATLLLPPALIAAYFGMNFIDRWAFPGFTTKIYWPFWILVGISIFFTISLVFVLRPIIRRRTRKVK